MGSTVTFCALEETVTTQNGKSAFFTRFAQEVLQINEEPHGFDLGCGRGDQARQLAEIGCRVTAVDRHLPPEAKDLPRLNFRRQDLRNWTYKVPEDPFDFVFCRNALHFLPEPLVYNQMLPRIREGLRPGGVVGIAAFYRRPEPDIPAHILSLHTLNRLTEVFQGWEILYAKDDPRDGPAMLQPGTFTWFTSRLVVRKPN